MSRPDRRAASASGPAGSLIVVGTGFLVAGQVTAEALAAMEGADRLLYVVSDAATRQWLVTLNPRSESLEDAYADGRLRTESYREMVSRILAPVRAGSRVCVAFYGHPGIFVHPSHEAIRQARAEGFPARMLPGISAEDCLFADLGLDPATAGCRSYEATDFLVRRRPVDPTTNLVLWQVGAIGVATYHRQSVWPGRGLQVLAEVLLEHYPPEHPVVLYTAATLPVVEPEIVGLPLARLAETEATVAATLLVPPAAPAAVDPAVAARLGLAEPLEEAC